MGSVSDIFPGVAQAPSNVEREVLAACLVDASGKAMRDLVGRMKAEWFGDPLHEEVWRAICSVWERHGAVDPVLVREHLLGPRRMPAAAAAKILLDLDRRRGLLGDLWHYVTLMRDRWALRVVAVACEHVCRELTRAELSPESACELAKSEVTKACARVAESGALETMAGSAFDDLTRMIEEAHRRRAAGEPLGVGFGLARLDDILDGGAHPGELVTVMGLRGEGKSTLLVQAASAAARSGRSVLFYTAEMSCPQVAGRLVATQSGVAFAKMRNGQLSRVQAEAVAAAIADLRQLRVEVVSAAGWNAREIDAHARRSAARESIDLVVVDHLHKLARPPRAASETDGLAMSVGALKSLALDLDTVVMMAAQPTAASGRPETGRSALPRLSMAHAKGSGAIADDSDIFLVVRRGQEGGAEITVEKHREGAGAGETVWCAFDGAHQRFV